VSTVLPVCLEAEKKAKTSGKKAEKVTKSLKKSGFLWGK